MYLRHLEWKLIFLALLGCFLVPAFLISTVLATVLQDAVPHGVRDGVSALLAFAGFLLPPVLGGWFTAKYARSLPRMHVLVVGGLGAVLSLLAFHSSPRAMAAYAIATLALTFLSGSIKLAGPRKDPG
jgi:hypothetical protein